MQSLMEEKIQATPPNASKTMFAKEPAYTVLSDIDPENVIETSTYYYWNQCSNTLSVFLPRKSYSMT